MTTSPRSTFPAPIGAAIRASVLGAPLTALMSDEPMWLTEAVVSAPGDSDPALREESPVDVLPGDICTVTPFDRSEGSRRLFLVIEAGDGWCKGMISSVETELATEVDALLTASETGLGYPIAIHTRYLGPIWMTQIQRRVGAVASDTLAEIERLAWNDEAQVTVRVGLPLQPEDIDPRYPALRSLSAELDTLTGYTAPETVFPAPIGAAVRFSVLGKPLTDTVTGYAVKTFGDDEHWTDVPCYVLAKFGAWPVRDCEVVR